MRGRRSVIERACAGATFIILAACSVPAAVSPGAGSPGAGSPADTRAPITTPGATLLHDNPGDGPPSFVLPPSPTPSGFAGGQNGDPWTGPAGPWPGRTLFTYPDDEDSGIIGVAADGTVYTQGNVSSTDYHVAIRAFAPDGTPVPSWPADGVPAKGFFRDAVLGTDDGIYVAMQEARKAGSSGTEPRSTTVTAVDPSGKVRAGWPVVRPATSYEPRTPFGHALVPRPAGGVCFVEMIGKASGPATFDVACLGTDGRPVAGWSYHPKMILGTPVFGPDGTLYVDEVSAGPGGTPASRIVALGTDGRPRAGWSPVVVAPSPDTQIAAGPTGAVYVLAKEYGHSPVVVAVDSTGKPDDGFDAKAAAVLGPLGAEAYTQGLELAPDGTLFLAIDIVVTTGPSKPAQIVALGPDGGLVAGWPFRPGSFFLWVRPGPDGSVWVWMGSAGASTPRLAVLGTDGIIKPGWPVLGPPTLHDIAFDRQGVPFYVSRPYGLDYLETIDAAR